MTQHYYASGPLQWGDVATWVGGIATALALILTFWLLLITRREQTGQREEQRQAQAHRVSGWSESIRQITDTATHAVTVSVQNSSNEPIYSVRAAVGDAWAGDHIRYAELELRYVMPPKDHQRQTVTLALSRTAADDYESSPPVELIFRDAAGRYWHRHRTGGLTEITENLPPSGATHFFTNNGGHQPT